MTDISAYILRMIVACLICTVITHLSSNLHASKNIIRALCGILMAVTFLSPILHLNWNHMIDFWEEIYIDAQTASTDGANLMQSNLSSGIKERLESYILDKASAYGCDVHVDVKLTEDNPPLPIEVTIRGEISPYYKTLLSNMMENDLGITKEMQIWTS